MGLGHNPCFRLPPNIGETRTVLQANPGNSTSFNLMTTNNDYYGCSPSEFSLSSPNQPAGVEITFPPTVSSFSLAPRQTFQTSLTLSVNTSTPLGVYPFTVEAKNLSTGLTSSRLFNLRVY